MLSDAQWRLLCGGTTDSDAAKGRASHRGRAADALRHQGSGTAHAVGDASPTAALARKVRIARRHVLSWRATRGGGATGAARRRESCAIEKKRDRR